MSFLIPLFFFFLFFLFLGVILGWGGELDCSGCLDLAISFLLQSIFLELLLGFYWKGKASKQQVGQGESRVGRGLGVYNIQFDSSRRFMEQI